MLESIRIEGNILDWKAPVEINFADEPIILTGRNGSGKSLIGKIIELSIESVKGDYKASKSRDKLCTEHGVERIVLKLKRPFYEQWSELLFTNLPFFILQNNHYEVGAMGGGEALKQHMDITFEAHHHMTYTWESNSGRSKTVFEHSLETRGYCEGFQSLNPLEENTTDLCGKMPLLTLANGPGNWKYMVHDIVVSLSRYLKDRDMILIPLDDKITLLTTDEAEDEDESDDFEFMEYKTENEMRAWLGKYNAIARHEEEQGIEHQLIWELKHKPPQEISQTSPVSNSYVKIASTGKYPNYFERLNLKYVSVNRKYKLGITKQKAQQGTGTHNPLTIDDELLEEFSDYGYSIVDDIRSVQEKYGITLDRRKAEKLEFGIEKKKLRETFDLIYADEDKSGEILNTGTIYHAMDEILRRWMLNEKNPQAPELVYLLHRFLWGRLLEQGKVEQIIANAEFGVDIEKLSSKLPSGIENLLSLLHEALTTEEGTVLFIDEPEISLHIDWQAKIVDAMWKLGKRNHIIFTTHSPEIVMTNLEKVITIPPEAL